MKVPSRGSQVPRSSWLIWAWLIPERSASWSWVRPAAFLKRTRLAAKVAWAAVTSDRAPIPAAGGGGAPGFRGIFSGVFGVRDGAAPAPPRGFAPGRP